MNELVWPSDPHDPSAQVVFGLTSRDEAPRFMKPGYECSIRVQSEPVVEVAGVANRRPVGRRKRKASVNAN